MLLTVTISVILLTLSLVYFLIQELREIVYLKRILHNTIGKGKIKTLEDIIKIKNFLNHNISYDAESKTENRPLLRHTAKQILKSGYGFCGENARVAIKLFLLARMKAGRIYLYRKEWQHVLVEHQLGENWYMFDGHYDENTLLHDDNVASIHSENIRSYPDHYPSNPYLDFCRIKIIYKLPVLRLYSKIRLPSFLVYILESPNLIKALGCLVLIGACVVISYSFGK